MFIIEDFLSDGDLIVFGTIFLISTILGLISYVFSSIALFTMSTNAGISKPWLAWIPIANVWIIGELVTDKLRGNGGMKYLIVTAIYILAFSIPYVKVIASIAYSIFAILVIYWIFTKHSNKPVLHTILSAIIPLYSAITLFIIRNNEEK